jgi:hypothetical protein
MSRLVKSISSLFFMKRSNSIALNLTVKMEGRQSKIEALISSV